MAVRRSDWWFISKFALIAGMLGIASVYGKGELGQKCSVDHDCKIGNSSCIFGICTCNIGTYQDTYAKKCLPGLQMGEKCNDEDFCSSINNVCIDGVCGCLPGYDPASSGCLPQGYLKQCNDKYRKDNGFYLVKQLGESCLTHAQCIEPFSHCDGGFCTCKPGFSNSDGRCNPDGDVSHRIVINRRAHIVLVVHCPTVKDPLQGENLIYCNMKVDGSHDCPSGMGCLPIDEPLVFRDDVLLAGFCCPQNPQSESEQVTNRCPYGLNEPISECSGEKWETYFAYSDVLFDTESEVLCCPRICTYERLYYDGKCYESLLRLNETCEFSFQCSPGQICVGNKCVCKEGHKQLYNDCFEALCPYGKPLTEADGIALTKCNGPGSCPTGHFCMTEFNICCQDLDDSLEESMISDGSPTH
ncbi:hypothetical protein M514_06930 [Trichuris suis]|uniref:EB domain-containing protein n=1 Tax=Trichuris suis TaxID=68888 RepID=A0A085M4S1_9BILA|nr:hypothetical protein M513_06930 [Trichuris suis]KFD70335.1 hypothetical protein M514_06930 [Trichuris suis]